MKTAICRFAWWVAAGWLFAFSATAGATALDDYVAAADTNYSYVGVGSGVFDWSTLTRGYTLDLTSQAWRDSSEVDHVLWRHWVTIVVPEWDALLGATKRTAMVLINDGYNTDPAPAIDPAYRQLAAGTRSVLAVLSAVPNQPLLAGRLEQIRRHGGNPFMDYQLPSAIIKFKQGFGRLIRSKTDTGIVVILDSRIVQKRYGREFLEAIPRCPVKIEPQIE